MLDALWLPELMGGRGKAYATIDGTVPTTNYNGLYQTGDIVFNMGTSGPAYWQCTAASTSSITWSPVGLIGAGFTTLATASTLAAAGGVYLLAAGSYTIPAPVANSGPYMVYAKASSVTLTPASGQINQASAVTLTSNQHGQWICDGTNFWQIA